jgi:hypothetical protein
MSHARSALRLAPLFLLAVAAGCGPAPGTKPDETAPHASPALKFLLDREPENARTVLEVKKDGKNGEEVVVAGFVGGPHPFDKGRAVLTIVDPSLEKALDEGSPRAWDLANVDRAELARASLSVRFVSDDNETLTEDAQKLFDLRVGQLVVVRGQLSREPGGVASVAAWGLFKQPQRPVD